MPPGPALPDRASPAMPCQTIGMSFHTSICSKHCVDSRDRQHSGSLRFIMAAEESRALAMDREQENIEEAEKETEVAAMGDLG